MSSSLRLTSALRVALGAAAVALVIPIASPAAQQPTARATNGSTDWDAQEILRAERFVRPPATVERIITTSLDNGVIPVVSTFAVHPNDEFQPQALLFNRKLIELATQYQIPLINLWAATRVLPNYGLDVDNTHLTMTGENQLYYDGGNDAFSGVALHNLLSIATLQLIADKVGGP